MANAMGTVLASTGRTALTNCRLTIVETLQALHALLRPFLSGRDDTQLRMHSLAPSTVVLSTPDTFGATPLGRSHAVAGGKAQPGFQSDPIQSSRYYVSFQHASLLNPQLDHRNSPTPPPSPQQMKLSGV